MANLPQELPEPPSSFKRHAITVLLIDDQVIISEAVRRMLADYPDIAFYYCQDPSKAVQMACDISPTVILLDLVMPEIDGLTLVKFFRANEKTRNIPLIVLSSKEEPDTKAEAFALGASDYLVKLPDKIELIARIRYHSNGYILRLQRNEAYEALLASQNALTNELNQAAEYVRSLLPPPLDGDIKTDWIFVPSTSLGGDSFGYHWIDDDHFAMYLLDVCGHGVGAALLSISVINALRSESLPAEDFRDPGKILATLNDVYQMEEHNNMFFTIWYGIYNKKRRDLVFASGGHPPAIAIVGNSSEASETVLLSSDGVAIGAMPGLEYHNTSFKLKPFTKLYIYSDGAYEITTPEGRMWKLEDFVKIISELSSKEDSTVNDIITEVREVQGVDTFEDDVSLVEFDF
ncbi:MAG: SpoIIE family protein phosphatase [Desulfatiglandaceae bacterium]